MALATAAAIAAIVSGGTAIAQGIGSAVKKRKAKQLEAPEEDPQQRLELARLKRQQKAFETGAAGKTDQERLMSILKQQGQNAARLSGGASGAAIAGGARNTAAIGEVLRKIGGETRKTGLQAGQLSSGLINNMAQRELELGLLKQSKLEAEAAQLSKAAQQNMQTSISYGMTAGTGEEGFAEGDILAKILKGKE